MLLWFVCCFYYCFYQQYRYQNHPFLVHYYQYFTNQSSFTPPPILHQEPYYDFRRWNPCWLLFKPPRSKMMKLIPRILALSFLLIALSISGGDAADGVYEKTPRQQKESEPSIRRRVTKSSKSSDDSSCFEEGEMCHRWYGNRRCMYKCCSKSFDKKDCYRWPSRICFCKWFIQKSKNERTSVKKEWLREWYPLHLKCPHSLLILPCPFAIHSLFNNNVSFESVKVRWL